jgi:SHAQKYF class myb-like DNA-binding protein
VTTIVAGRWTAAEHDLFVKGLQMYNKQWKMIAELIQTRTVVQVRTHAQKYFLKLMKKNKSYGVDLEECSIAEDAVSINNQTLEIQYSGMK